MEVIRIAGYTEDETNIAIKYLIPKQLKGHGLKKGDIIIPEKLFEILLITISREAGVRNLERQIAKMRKGQESY